MGRCSGLVGSLLVYRSTHSRWSDVQEGPLSMSQSMQSWAALASCRLNLTSSGLSLLAVSLCSVSRLPERDSRSALCDENETEARTVLPVLTLDAQSLDSDVQRIYHAADPNHPHENVHQLHCFPWSTK